jgi:uncharacterized RDD family membrane protein YckC
MARMKCPNCGFTNERTGTRCLRCGSGLVEHPETPIAAEAIPTSQPANVPEWRQEVTRKAREFGERKKTLTTPPRPLKEQPADTAEENQRYETSKAEPVFARIEPPASHPKEELSSFSPPPRVHEPPIPIIIKEAAPQHRLELDVPQMIAFEEESDAEAPLHVGRRAASFLVDHAIMGAVIFVVGLICRELFSYDLQTINRSSPLAVISGILLFHFIYYFYFLKTARQTPGQVFFSLEVREPLSGTSIGSGKIFSRWASIVFLNVFNVVPLFFGKKFLLMDHLSGTVVRSMKPED